MPGSRRVRSEGGTERYPSADGFERRADRRSCGCSLGRLDQSPSRPVNENSPWKSLVAVLRISELEYGSRDFFRMSRAGDVFRLRPEDHATLQRLHGQVERDA